MFQAASHHAHDTLGYIAEQASVLDFSWSLTSRPHYFDLGNEFTFEIKTRLNGSIYFYDSDLEKCLIKAICFIDNLERETAV